MKLTFASIVSPLFIDSDNVEGMIDGKSVKVSRRLNGWTPRIMVVVDGVVVHDDNVKESDKAEFDGLQHRAWLEQEAIRDKARLSNNGAVKLLYTK